jgi:hypothetical protein
MSRVLIVGAGGIGFYGTPVISNMVNRMGDGCWVKIVDPDVVTGGNVARQWGRVGEGKAGLMGMAISNVVRETGDWGGIEWVQRPVGRSHIRELVGSGNWHRVVVCMPDNHLTRMRVHKEMWEGMDFYMSAGMEKDDTGAWGIYAGNDETSGWAYGCRYVGDRIEGDWVPYAQDVLEKAEEQGRRERGELGCGEVQEVVVGQTALSNMMTAAVIGRCVGDMFNNRASMWYWITKGDGTLMVCKRAVGMDKVTKPGYMDRVPGWGQEVQDGR